MAEVSEDWRPVVGYEGIYSISSLGRARRDRAGRGTIAGRILTAKVATNDYLRVDLSRDDKKRRVSIHRLVAEAFIGPAPSLAAVVNHIDGDKTNNRPVNLEWCSVTENNRHARINGLARVVPVCGERNGRAVLTEQQVSAIRKLKGIIGKRALAQVAGVSKSLVQKIHQGKLWPEDLRVREWPA